MGFRQKKWHIENKVSVLNYFEGICQNCSKVCLVYEGAVHHKTYKNVNGLSVYEAPLTELFSNNIIIWVCHRCHGEIHETEVIDQSTKIRYECFICGNKEGLMERSKLINFDKPLCKYCFRQMRDEKSLPSKQLKLF